MDSNRKWFSVVYLTLIIAFVHLIFTFLFSHKLTLYSHKVRIKRQPELPLRFRSDGTFKILQVADMHYGNGLLTRCRDVLGTEFDHCTDLNTTQFLRKLIEIEKPDFVAFTGDNIFGTSATDAAESLFEAFGPVLESGLPWAAVLGNHDQESTMSRGELMSFISLMDYSLSKTYPSAEDSLDSSMHCIDGFGNYNLEVLGASGSAFANCNVLDLYFLDSGDRATVNGFRTYGWIKESQLSWLRGVSNKFQEKCLDMNTSEISPRVLNPPALAFFHIPIPEIRQVPMKDVVGHYQEHAAVSIVNSGVLQSFISMGNLKAVFIGHDHTNDFCGKLDRIWFCYGGGIGYHGYGKAGWPRRARIILAELAKGERTWTSVERVKTWKRLNDKNLSQIDEHVLWDRYSSDN